MTGIRPVIWGILCLTTLGQAQTFNDFINRLNASPPQDRPAIVDSFMTAAGNFPYIEFDTLAHFIYRGNANTVTVPGDANGWDPASYPMHSVSATDFWYHSHIFESDARLDYKFVLNGNNWILDPLNPYTVIGGYGPNSELRMPAYVMPPEIEFYPGIPHGTLQDTVMYSEHLGNSRQIRVYTPPGYDSSEESYPVILFHDGLEYISLASADNVLDYLIHQQRIAPVIGVFVPPVNRTDEYAGNLMDEFSAFITGEVIPWVDSRFRTLISPEHRATLGASNGGNISLWLGLHHSDVFGKIAAQSSNVVSAIAEGYESGPFLDLQFYLDLGTYDIAALIPRVRNFVEILEARDYPYLYYEYHEGHSWGNWRAHIDNALEMFFPGQGQASEPPTGPVPREFDILFIYPNPFNASATIAFTIPRAGRVSLSLYNITGRRVAVLADSVYQAGEHRVMVDGSALSSGVYFARLTGDHAQVSRKLLLLK